jgi:uncharacterized protein YndB with AHSA1/START domain
MAKIDRTTTLAAPIERVWEFVGDPLRWPEWQPSIGDAELIGENHYRLLGGERRTFGYEVMVTERSAPERISWEYGEGIHGAGSYTLQAVGGGTEVRMHERLRLNMLPPARWVIDWLFFNRSYNRAAKEALGELRRVVESPSKTTTD